MPIAEDQWWHAVRPEPMRGPGKDRRGAHRSTLKAFSGSIFLYILLIRDSGKTGYIMPEVPVC
jgi:hypothetical protein